MFWISSDLFPRYSQCVRGELLVTSEQYVHSVGFMFRCAVFETSRELAENALAPDDLLSVRIFGYGVCVSTISMKEALLFALWLREMCLSVEGVTYLPLLIIPVLKIQV